MLDKVLKSLAPSALEGVQSAVSSAAGTYTGALFGTNRRAGANDRAFLNARHPGTSAWEQLGSSASSPVPNSDVQYAGQRTQRRGQDTQKEIAELQARTQKYVSDNQLETARVVAGAERGVDAGPSDVEWLQDTLGLPRIPKSGTSGLYSLAVRQTAATEEQAFASVVQSFAAWSKAETARFLSGSEDVLNRAQAKAATINANASQLQAIVAGMLADLEIELAPEHLRAEWYAKKTDRYRFWLNALALAVPIGAGAALVGRGGLAALRAFRGKRAASTAEANRYGKHGLFGTSSSGAGRAAGRAFGDSVKSDIKAYGDFLRSAVGRGRFDPKKANPRR